MKVEIHTQGTIRQSEDSALKFHLNLHRDTERHTHHPYFLHSFGVPHYGTNGTNDRHEQCHANKYCEQNSKRT